MAAVNEPISIKQVGKSTASLLIPTRMGSPGTLAIIPMERTGVASYIRNLGGPYREFRRKDDGMMLAQSIGTDFVYNREGGRSKVYVDDAFIIPISVIEVGERYFAGVGRGFDKQGALTLVRWEGSTPVWKSSIYPGIPSLSSIEYTKRSVYLAAGAADKNVVVIETDYKGKLLRNFKLLQDFAYTQPKITTSSDGRVLLTAQRKSEGNACVDVASYDAITFKLQWLKEYCDLKNSNEFKDVVTLTDGRIAVAINSSQLGSKNRTSLISILSSDGKEVVRQQTTYFVANDGDSGTGLESLVYLPKKEEIVAVGLLPFGSDLVGWLHRLSARDGKVLEDKKMTVEDPETRGMALDYVQQGSKPDELFIFGRTTGRSGSSIYFYR